jgi:hypothetical protein
MEAMDANAARSKSLGFASFRRVASRPPVVGPQNSVGATTQQNPPFRVFWVRSGQNGSPNSFLEERACTPSEAARPKIGLIECATGGREAAVFVNVPAL